MSNHIAFLERATEYEEWKATREWVMCFCISCGSYKVTQRDGTCRLILYCLLVPIVMESRDEGFTSMKETVVQKWMIIPNMSISLKEQQTIQRNIHDTNLFRQSIPFNI